MRILELWLFTFCTNMNLISDSLMDKWLVRIAKMKRLYTGTLYISQSLWGAKIKHPNLPFAHTMEQLIAILGKDHATDVVYVGEYNELVKRQLKIVCMEEVHELS